MKDIQRINRQNGAFIDGLGLWGVHNFLQPVYFVHYEGIVYNNPKNNITDQYLFPVDDPLSKIADPILISLSECS